MSKKSSPRATFTGRALSPLKLRRLNLGLRQEDLARAVGLNPVSISRLETGLSGTSPKTAAAIARVLGVSVPEIFPGLDLPAEKMEGSRARRG